MLLGILLNSVGTVILQSIATMGQTKVSAAILEAFKDLPIAAMSFLLASLLPRFGYRRAMILGAAMVGLACLALPLVPTFAMAKRSEEHTSELQSLMRISYAVFCLKKKKTTIIIQ